MRVGGSQIQTLVNNTLQNRDAQRQQVQQDVYEQEKARQRQQQTVGPEPDVQISDAARRAAQNQTVQSQTVAAPSQSANTQRNYQYYPYPDHSGLSATQQRAVQTYANNQHLSRVEGGKGEFLGSVDVFA